MLCYCEILPFLQGRIFRSIICKWETSAQQCWGFKGGKRNHTKKLPLLPSTSLKVSCKKRFAKSRRLCYNMKVMNQKNACRMQSLQWLLLDVRRVTERCKKSSDVSLFVIGLKIKTMLAFLLWKTAFFARLHVGSVIGKQTTTAQ